jgi:hypothetical protein
MSKSRKYPNNPNWRKMPRTKGGGAKPKWGKWGRMVRINGKLRSVMMEQIIATFGSVQNAVDEMWIKPYIEDCDETSTI